MWRTAVHTQSIFTPMKPYLVFRFCQNFGWVVENFKIWKFVHHSDQKVSITANFGEDWWSGLSWTAGHVSFWILVNFHHIFGYNTTKAVSFGSFERSCIVATVGLIFTEKMNGIGQILWAAGLDTLFTYFLWPKSGIFTNEVPEGVGISRPKFFRLILGLNDYDGENLVRIAQVDFATALPTRKSWNRYRGFGTNLNGTSFQKC